MYSPLAHREPKIYDWDVTGAPVGMGGISFDRKRAIGAMHQALKDSPIGASGVVRQHPVSGRGRLADGDVIQRAELDPVSGEVIAEDL
jgi:hypothetical protein